MAGKLASAICADLHQIIPKQAYSKADLDWTNKDSRTSIEMNNPSSRPEIANLVENMESYDTIFLAFPIWWYVAPTIINTFLEQYDMHGKIIIPIATSGGSGMGNTNHALTKSCLGAELKKGNVFDVDVSENELRHWVEQYR